jgi:DNA-binding CsgD family transcriptional regulator
MSDRLTPESLADLIGCIYEAAVDPLLWPVFLKRFAATMRAPNAVLWTHDFSTHGAEFGDGHSTMSGVVGLDPAFLESYVSHYSEVNVWTRSETTLPEGVAVNSSMLYPDEELPATEYYNDWLRPQDLRYAIGGIVAKRASLGVKLSALRPARVGEYETRELAFYRLLLPHLQRACALHRKLTVRRSAAASALDALELAPGGAWLFDATGAVVYENRAARSIATRANGLWLDPGGRPMTADAAQTLALHRLVGSAVQTGVRRGTAAGGSMLVHRTSAPDPLHVLVSPLPADSPVLGATAAAVAFISAIAASPGSVDLRLPPSDQLTQAEEKLVHALADGLSVKHYAAIHGRSENTIRSQLKSAMAKLGVRRQVELVRVVLAARARMRGDKSG